VKGDVVAVLQQLLDRRLCYGVIEASGIGMTEDYGNSHGLEKWTELSRASFLGGDAFEEVWPWSLTALAGSEPIASGPAIPAIIVFTSSRES
jgi:hypothetical protein